MFQPGFFWNDTSSIVEMVFWTWSVTIRSNWLCILVSAAHNLFSFWAIASSFFFKIWFLSYFKHCQWNEKSLSLRVRTRSWSDRRDSSPCTCMSICRLLCVSLAISIRLLWFNLQIKWLTRTAANWVVFVETCTRISDVVWTNWARERLTVRWLTWWTRHLKSLHLVEMRNSNDFSASDK